MKHRHHTCVIVCGDGQISVWYWDMYVYMGLSIHIAGRPRWWAESLCAIPEG